MVMENEFWQPPAWLYAFFLCSCGAAIYGRFHLMQRRSRMPMPNLETSVNSFTHLPPPFIVFQRNYLSVYFLASVVEGLQAVCGEYIYRQHGFTREDMSLMFAAGYLTFLLLGTFLGILTDFIGRKKACIAFCIFHLIGSLAKQCSTYQSFWMATISVALASCLFSCAFETWMTAEHEQLGFRQDWLSDTFWTMSFGGSASAIGSAVLANVLVKWQAPHGMTLPSATAAVVAVICFFLIAGGWEENRSTLKVRIPRTVLAVVHLMADKRMLLLGWAQSCFDFAVTVFWFLWTPTIVADGRDVYISMIYPCLMGSVMLGSVAVSWLLCGPYFVRPEAYLPVAFVTASLTLAVPAYDYQEIGMLVALFCLFNICVGIISPSLARLRSIYVPNDLRAGMISLSRVPANAGIVFVLLKAGYYHNLENSTILTMCIVGLISGAVCLHILNRWSCLTASACWKSTSGW